jgi:menaquinone-9 beta-reductase
MAELYDIAIVGGGLAGLALAIQSKQAGHSVILFEKESYPFNKVCGEYISMESWDFIMSLGIPLPDLHLPKINALFITGTNGINIKAPLPLGGFGVRRLLLDNLLYETCQQLGVTVLTETKVDDIIFDGKYFTVTTATQKVKATVAAGCFGKRSNIDVKWKRQFITNNDKKLTNYIGVKYHIHTTAPANEIALHNFKDGYCGMSKVDDNRYCLCYLTTAQNLKSCNNSIQQLEETILKQNPFLKNILETSQKLTDSAETIAQISFSKKTQTENNVLLIGDSAGMITPLCGNGMSMALHGSKIAFEAINNFLQEKITRAEMEETYTKKWRHFFEKRLKAGRAIQQIFGRKWATNLFLTVLKPFPFVIKLLIKMTHGAKF